VDKFKKSMGKQWNDWVSNLKSVDDLSKISFDFGDFNNQLMIGYLQEREDVQEIKYKEFEEYEDSTDEPINPFNQRFDAAEKWFMDKVAVSYDDLDGPRKNMANQAFYVKNITDLKVANDIQDELLDSMQNGDTQQNFKDYIERYQILSGLDFGNTSNYWDTVFRTNIQSAYQAGHYDQMMSVSKDLPIFQYVSIEDDRTSEICQEYDGITLRNDDKFWDTNYPPNHMNCRSTVIALSEEDAPPETDKADIDGLSDTEQQVKAGGFDYSVGKDYNDYLNLLQQNAIIKGRGFKDKLDTINLAKKKEKLDTDDKKSSYLKGQAKYLGYKYDEEKKVAISPSGLEFGINGKYGTRINHVIRHFSEKGKSKNHTYFSSTGKDGFAMIDRAYKNLDKITIEPSRNDFVGYAKYENCGFDKNGKVINHVKFVFSDKEGKNIISIYPQEKE